MFVVTVTFNIHPTRVGDFKPLMLQQAGNSLAGEPGCQVFDVCQSDEDPSEFFLYEMYDDRPAFEAHLASGHYRTFDADVAGMVAEKRVKVFSRL